MNSKNPLSKKTQIFLLFLTAAIIFFPRSVNPVDYVTADEPLYLRESANFYYLLKEGRFDETDLIVHPGVPSLWAGALGFNFMFSEYLEDPRTEFPMADLNFRKVLENGGTNRKYMLAVGRLFSISLETGLLMVAFYLGQKVFGVWPSLFITLLISFDPFYFANSRILQPDGILSTAIYLSLIACLNYLYTRNKLALLISGISASLAILSKVPGIILLPLIAGVLFASWWWKKFGQNRTKKELIRLIGDYLIWFVVVIVVIFALWPVMWGQPWKAISELIAFTAEASGEVNSPMFFNGTVLPEGEFGLDFAYFYPLSFLWRTTPVVLIGLLLGIFSLFLKSKPSDFWRDHGFSTLAFLISALVMIFFFTLSAKKFDRYILPAMVYIDVVAALGYLAFLSTFDFKWRLRFPKSLGFSFAMLVVVGIQAGMIVQAYPYYHSYYNPLLGGLEKAQHVMQIGWGEGLNEAAEYLNQLPANTKHLNVRSWYSAAFDFHSDIVSQEIPISGPIDNVLLSEFMGADYWVIYLCQRQRLSSQRLLDFLEDKTPEHIVTIRGVEYVWIYNVEDITRQAKLGN